MGEVYLAEDERLGRQVALKILPLNMLDDRSRLKRFEREARTVSALNHPNILTIYDLEEEDGIHLFASEFVKGITLREKLDSGRLSILETLEIAIQMASALQAAHEAGVVHRDIKPENVMIREDGYVKVLDFGLAKLKEKAEATDSDRTLTQRFSLPGVIMGTVSYMSPEQARGTDIDGRSDISALGS
jgi:serine/threonine protein kinase